MLSLEVVKLVRLMNRLPDAPLAAVMAVGIFAAFAVKSKWRSFSVFAIPGTVEPAFATVFSNERSERMAASRSGAWAGGAPKSAVEAPPATADTTPAAVAASTLRAPAVKPMAICPAMTASMLASFAAREAGRPAA